MFRFSPYLLSQDKVEMSVLQEICDRIHTQTHTVAEGGDVSSSSLFSSAQQRLTQRRHLIKSACPQNKKEVLSGEGLYLQIEGK